MVAIKENKETGGELLQREDPEFLSLSCVWDSQVKIFRLAGDKMKPGRIEGIIWVGSYKWCG